MESKNLLVETIIDHVIRRSVVKPGIELVNDGFEADDGKKTRTETC